MAHGTGCLCRVCLDPDGGGWGQTGIDLLITMPVTILGLFGLAALLVWSGEYWPLTALALCACYFRLRDWVRRPR